jgi:hypothetical protein
MIRVNCWNEYDTLKTVILGSTFDNNRIPVLYDDNREQDAFSTIVEETNHDLRGIKNILQEHGVTVLSPTQPQNYNLLIGQHIKTHTPLLNMRDFHMAYGNMFFMTHGSYKTRRFQHFWLEDIANQMIDDGNIVIAANEPNFDIKSTPIELRDRRHEWMANYKDLKRKKNLVHTACILKYNKCAFISKNPGTDTGKTWIKNLLALQGIELKEIDGYGHLDAQNAILRNDVLFTTDPSNDQWGDTFKYKICATSDELIQESKKIHSALFEQKIWKKPSSWLKEWQGYYQEFRSLHNCLAISPDKVLVSRYDKTVFDQLKNIGIEAIYVEWRNSAIWGGGLHCITCDIERDS